MPFTYRVKVGEIEVTAVSDGFFQAPLANFVGADEAKANELAAKVNIKPGRVRAGVRRSDDRRFRRRVVALMLWMAARRP